MRADSGPEGTTNVLQDAGDVVHGEAGLLTSIGLHEERQWLGNTNGIRELHKASCTQAAAHHRLCHLSANVGCGSVRLGRVLARECTTTTSTPATVGVDDDLAASETGITLRATTQADGRVAILQLDLLKSALDHLLLNLLFHLLHAWGSHLSSLVALALLAAHSLQRLSVLSGNHHGVDLLWLNGAIRVLQVLNGHLGLAIWAQPPALTALANISQGLAPTRGHGVGQRHAVRCLITGISKHDALVTGTHVQVLLVHMAPAAMSGLCLLMRASTSQLLWLNPLLSTLDRSSTKLSKPICATWL